MKDTPQTESDYRIITSIVLHSEGFVRITGLRLKSLDGKTITLPVAMHEDYAGHYRIVNNRTFLILKGGDVWYGIHPTLLSPEAKQFVPEGIDENIPDFKHGGTFEFYDDEIFSRLRNPWWKPSEPIT